MALTDKQRRFVEEYLIDLNATQAAIRTGYSPNAASVQGARLIANANVAAALAKKQAALARKFEITQEKVLAELARLGFSNIADYVDVSGDAPAIALRNVEREKLAALSEITTETVYENRGRGDTAEVRRVKLKLWDKRAALVDLGKHLGLFKDRLEVEGGLNLVITPDDAKL